MLLELMKQDHDNIDLTPLSTLLQPYWPLPFFCPNVILLMKTSRNTGRKYAKVLK